MKLPNPGNEKKYNIYQLYAENKNHKLRCLPKRMKRIFHLAEEKYGENMRDIITVAARCEDTFMIAVEVQELRWDKNHFHN